MTEELEDSSGLPSFRAGTEELQVEARGNFTEKHVQGYVPSPESDQLQVKITQFEGPFDLLLHLLDKEAVDILDIPIGKVIQEYMKVLDGARELNLDIAGEFLVMAAQLAHIKSRMLLPKEERPPEDQAEGDPRADLVRRLLEYQRFKEVAAKLDDLPHLGRDVFARPASLGNVPIKFDGAIPDAVVDIYAQLNLAETDPFDLIRLFDEMLRAQQKIVVHEVLVERISVGARINELVDVFASGLTSSFADLCDRFGPRTRKSVIVTFLAVLEMTRLKLTRVSQDDDGAILITPVMDNLRGDDIDLAQVQEFDGAAPVDITEPVEASTDAIEATEPTEPTDSEAPA